MSSKNTYRNIPTVTTIVQHMDKSNIYTSESENDDWNNIPTNSPILAQGCGSYSEDYFGFYLGSGTITKISFNAYPVESNATFTIKLKAIDKDYNEVYYPLSYTFVGRMDTKNVSLVLPFSDNQLVIYFVSATNYPVGLARIRLYISVTE